jgi:hypothetical protein
VPSWTPTAGPLLSVSVTRTAPASTISLRVLWTVSRATCLASLVTYCWPPLIRHRNCQHDAQAHVFVDASWQRAEFDQCLDLGLAGLPEPELAAGQRVLPGVQPWHATTRSTVAL